MLEAVAFDEDDWRCCGRSRRGENPRGRGIRTTGRSDERSWDDCVETVDAARQERPAMKLGIRFACTKVREGTKAHSGFEGGHRACTGARATSPRGRYLRTGRERSGCTRRSSTHRGDPSARVRRAKLYFLRDLKGKAARMKEQKKA
jgi:hypothetical protein